MRFCRGLALLLVMVPAVFAVGCGTQSSVAVTAAEPGDYVAAADRLLAPVGRLASAVAARTERPDAPAPSRAELVALVAQAEQSLADFDRLRVADPALRTQQGRLVRRYRDVIGAMGPLVDSLAEDDEAAALPVAAGGFFDALDALSIAAGGGE